jgi:hypothetical protein
MFNIPGAINLINTVAAYTSPLFIASTLLLYTPETWLNKVGLLEIKTNYKTWIGLVFVISFSFLISSGISLIIKKIKAVINEKSVRQAVIDSLHSLTPEEKEYLAGYIVNQTQTQNFNIQDGVVTGLKNKYIIYRASNVGTMFGPGFAFNINTFAYNYLMKNPHLLGEPE